MFYLCLLRSSPTPWHTLTPTSKTTRQHTKISSALQNSSHLCFGKAAGRAAAWNTIEELGITFGDEVLGENETYNILVVDEEKALPWLNFYDQNNIEPPYNVKNHTTFYRFRTDVLADYDIEGRPRTLEIEIVIGGILGAGWVYTRALFLRERRKNEKGLDTPFADTVRVFGDCADHA